MNIGLFISGELGYSVLKMDSIQTQNILFVSTNLKSENIIQHCKDNGIRCFVGNPRKDDGLLSYLKDHNSDLCLSVNYLFLLPKELIEVCEPIVNFHGSLLPKYRGRTPHVWAIINNEKEVGITAHLIDQGCDTGDILVQKRIPIDSKVTGGDVLNSYLNHYPTIIEEVITNFSHLLANAKQQDDNFATYFGARTPEDGEIVWDWQKERIHNWVRAQANPYPGAFSYLNGMKCVIDSVSYSERGFDWETINGTIIGFHDSKPLVKVSNGVIQIESIRNNNNLKFKENDRFSNQNREL